MAIQKTHAEHLWNKTATATCKKVRDLRAARAPLCCARINEIDVGSLHHHHQAHAETPKDHVEFLLKEVLKFAERGAGIAEIASSTSVTHPSVTMYPVYPRPLLRPLLRCSSF